MSWFEALSTIVGLLLAVYLLVALLFPDKF